MYNKNKKKKRKITHLLYYFIFLKKEPRGTSPVLRVQEEKIDHIRRVSERLNHKFPFLSAVCFFLIFFIYVFFFFIPCQPAVWSLVADATPALTSMRVPSCCFSDSE